MTRPVRTPASGAAPDVRAHNLARALRLIAGGTEAVSRAGIAERAGLTRATAGSLVDDLISLGLVREESAAPDGRVGRPATGLRLDGNGASALGLEVNVDYLAVTLVDLAGGVIGGRVVVEDSRERPPARTVARLARLAATTLARASGAGPLAGIAVAVPGLVDAASGTVRKAPNLGWTDVGVLEQLRRHRALPDVPASVLNEADAAAVAETVHGAVPTESFVRVSGEVGVGGGIVWDGALLQGGRGWGGELGHVTVAADGPACRCGSRGCLEQYAGQEAVLRAAGLPAPAVTARGGSAMSPTIAVLLERAAAGDRNVLRALTRAGRALGLALSGVLNVLDIPTVVLGGSSAVLAPWLTPALLRELHERVVWAAWDEPRVIASRLGPEAAVLGAAESVRQRLLDSPAEWSDKSH